MHRSPSSRALPISFRESPVAPKHSFSSFAASIDAPRWHRTAQLKFGANISPIPRYVNIIQYCPPRTHAHAASVSQDASYLFSASPDNTIVLEQVRRKIIPENLRAKVEELSEQQKKLRKKWQPEVQTPAIHAAVYASEFLVFSYRNFVLWRPPFHRRVKSARIWYTLLFTPGYPMKKQRTPQSQDYRYGAKNAPPDDYSHAIHKSFLEYPSITLSGTLRMPIKYHVSPLPPSVLKAAS